MRVCPGACARARARVALLIQLETRMRHIYCHLWPLWFHHIFRQSLINGAIFGKIVIEREVCVLIFCTNFI